MNIRLEAFLDLSVALTGFDRLQLVSTGVAPEYLDTLSKIVPEAIVVKLLDTYAGLKDPATLSREILDDPALGPVARTLIVMWYTGTWTPLPDDWCETHGRSPQDVAHVVSSEAYLAGLQWSTVGAHPPGGLPPGFASWAYLPPGVQP